MIGMSSIEMLVLMLAMTSGNDLTSLIDPADYFQIASTCR